MRIGNDINGKDGIDSVTHNENEDMDSAVDEVKDLRMNDISGEMETPPCVLADNRIGCDMEDEPLLLDIVIGWWRKEKV